MRLPLTANISTKDGVLAKNARMTNVLEQKNKSGKAVAEIRPGTEVVGEFGASSGNGIVDFNGTLLSVFDSQLSIVDMNPPVVVSFPETEVIGVWVLPVGTFYEITAFNTGASVEDYSNLMVAGFDFNNNDIYYWTEASGIVSLGIETGSDLVFLTSDGGTIVGTNVATFQMFFYDVATSTQTPYPNSSYPTYASAITSDASVVVGYMTTTALRAFRWTASGGFVDLGIAEGGNYSIALGVSGDGTVVIGAYRNSSGKNVPMKWTSAGGMVSLGAIGLDGTTTTAKYISEDGLTIYGQFSPTLGGLATRVFVWTSAGGILDIDPSLTYSRFTLKGISGDGSTAVGELYYSGRYYGFSWTSAGGIQLKSMAGDIGSIAYATDFYGGKIVGGSEFAALNQSKAWSWTLENEYVTVSTMNVGKNVLPQARFITTDGDGVAGVAGNGTSMEYGIFVFGGTDVPPTFRDLVDMNNDKMDFVQSTL